jgi:hypothetical protein
MGAFIGALLYGAMKVDLALKGQVGVAGFPNRPRHEQDHGGQWGNVAVAVLCAAVALATVQPWGRSIPRWLLLAASWTIYAGLGPGRGADVAGAWPLRAARADRLDRSAGGRSRHGLGDPMGRDRRFLPAALAWSQPAAAE